MSQQNRIDLSCSHFLRSNAPRCGSGPKCRLEGPPPPPPCAASRGQPWTPLTEHCKKGQGGGGRGKEGGWGGRGCGWREGAAPPIAGAFQGQLGPDPHLGAFSQSRGCAINRLSTHISVRSGHEVTRSLERCEHLTVQKGILQRGSTSQIEIREQRHQGRQDIRQ